MVPHRFAVSRRRPLHQGPAAAGGQGPEYVRRARRVQQRRGRRIQPAGQTLRLRPFTTRPKRFYFVFRDASSGQETYEAARFLYADLLDDGTTVLDFNQAYNPPCAFNGYTTCPIPIRENRLPVKILAGEKDYPIHVSPESEESGRVRPGLDQGQTGVRPGSDGGQTRVRRGVRSGSGPSPRAETLEAYAGLAMSHPISVARDDLSGVSSTRARFIDSLATAYCMNPGTNATIKTDQDPRIDSPRHGTGKRPHDHLPGRHRLPEVCICLGTSSRTSRLSAGTTASCRITSTRRSVRPGPTCRKPSAE